MCIVCAFIGYTNFGLFCVPIINANNLALRFPWCLKKRLIMGCLHKATTHLQILHNMFYKSPTTSTHFIYRICLIQGPLFLVRGVLWESRNPILENTENTKIVKRHSTQPKSYKKCLSFLGSPKYLSMSISILKVLSSIWAVHCKCRNKNFHQSFFVKLK